MTISIDSILSILPSRKPLRPYPTVHAAELFDSTSVRAIIRVWAVLPVNFDPHHGELCTRLSPLCALRAFRGADVEPLVRVWLAADKCENGCD